MIAVGLIGFPEKVRNALEIAFRSRCGEEFGISTRHAADAYVVDLEGEGDIDNVQKLLRDSKAPVIVLAESLETLEGAQTLLRKPLRFTQLVEALRTAVRHEPSPGADNESASSVVSLESPASANGSASKRSASGARPPRKRSGNGASTGRQQSSATGEGTSGSFVDFLCDQVAQMRRRPTSEIVSIRVGSGNRILVDPRTERVATNLRQGSVRLLANTPLAILKPQLDKTAPSSLAAVSNTGIARDVDDLVWCLLKETRESALLSHIDPRQACCLPAWPGLRCLLDDPKNFALASYWTRRRSSIEELSDLFDLPAPEIARVLCAVRLVVGSDENSQELAARPPERHLERSPLRHILDRMLATFALRAA